MRQALARYLAAFGVSVTPQRPNGQHKPGTDAASQM
jgi:hypothetical protein